MNRYYKEDLIKIDDDLYYDILDSKKIKSIMLNRTIEFNIENLYKYDFINHKIEPVDKLISISYKYYNTPAYWWIIALCNNKKNDFDLIAGENIRVYFPPNEIMKEIIK